MTLKHQRQSSVTAALRQPTALYAQGYSPCENQCVLQSNQLFVFDDKSLALGVFDAQISASFCIFN